MTVPGMVVSGTDTIHLVRGKGDQDPNIRRLSLANLFFFFFNFVKGKWVKLKGDEIIQGMRESFQTQYTQPH